MLIQKGNKNCTDVNNNQIKGKEKGQMQHSSKNPGDIHDISSSRLVVFEEIDAKEGEERQFEKDVRVVMGLKEIDHNRLLGGEGRD